MFLACGSTVDGPTNDIFKMAVEGDLIKFKLDETEVALPRLEMHSALMYNKN